MTNETLNKTIEVLESKLAQKINVIDFENENPFTEYFVVCETSNQRQIDAVVNGFSELSKKGDITIRNIDGKADSGWIAIDLYDVVVHVFDKPTRAEYDLDKLFFKYPQTKISENV